jgi:hypothetical protein
MTNHQSQYVDTTPKKNANYQGYQEEMEFSLPKFGSHSYQTIDHRWIQPDKENFE